MHELIIGLSCFIVHALLLLPLMKSEKTVMKPGEPLESDAETDLQTH